MEHVTKPEHVVFLVFLFCVFCVVAWWWLHPSKKEERTKVDFDPVGIVAGTWAALLHWRPVKNEAFVDAEPEPARSDQFPLPNGQEPQFTVREPNANQVQLHLNADEVAALQRMIEHNKTAAKPSKTSSIQAGFGLSRGGGEKYQRASLIYDALFGPPAPVIKYRERSPEQDELRKQLRLN